MERSEPAFSPRLHNAEKWLDSSANSGERESTVDSVESAGCPSSAFERFERYVLFDSVGDWFASPCEM